MKVSFDFKERHHVFYMYNAAIKPLNLNRHMRRRLMRIAQKFNTNEDLVNLKPDELELTKNLTKANLSAYERILIEPLLEDEVIKSQFEQAHLSLSNVLDKLSKIQGEKECQKKKQKIQ